MDSRSSVRPNGSRRVAPGIACRTPALAMILALLAVCAVGTVSARERTPRIVSPPGPGDRVVSPEFGEGARSAAVPVDTTFLADFTFDGILGCDPQGWTPRDRTAQRNRFHVDDFTWLTMPGPWYAPIEGQRSLWCGVPPSPTDPELCSYATLPGYGNGWDQAFCLRTCQGAVPDATVEFDARWDMEAGYDGIVVEYDACDDNWTPAPGTDPSGFHLTGRGEGHVSITVPPGAPGSTFRVRIRVRSDGAWSDQDGLYDSEGAILLDSLGVRTSAGWLVQPEDFEKVASGDTSTADWTACVPPGYGSFAGLFPGTTVLQEDPCARDLTCLWGFFAGSPYDYGCGGHPEQLAVPYGNSRGQYLDNAIVSPWVPLTGAGSAVEMAFDVYADQPVDALVFYTWEMQSMPVTGCPAGWVTNNYLYWPDVRRRWLRETYRLDDLIPWGPPAPAAIRVSLIVIDACPFWCGVYGTGACHTHGPLFDNVSLYRFDDTGPRWSVDEAMLFQDAFPEDGTVTGTARADAARDILPGWPPTPTVRPGDSCVVRVYDPDFGLDTDPVAGGPAVYAWVHCTNPAHGSTALTDDPVRWPVVDSMVVFGRTWVAVRMDSVRDASGVPTSTDEFCIDLHDGLFTPGDTIEFVFSARSAGGVATTYWTRDVRRTKSQGRAFMAPMEFTVLPTGTSEILYVDCADGRGFEPFWMKALEQVGLTADRYDVRSPFSPAQNGLATRVRNIDAQIIAPYRTILWGGGNASNTIGDGDWQNGNKSDDATLLWRFLDQSTTAHGVVFTGRWLAVDGNGGSGLGGNGPNLFGYITHSLVASDHRAFGLPVSPTVQSVPGGCFDAAGLVDTLLLWGGCPSLPHFPVIEATGTAHDELVPAAPTGQPAAFAVAQSSINGVGHTVGAVLTTFALADVRSGAVPVGASPSAVLLGAMLDCIGQPHTTATGVRPSATWRTTLSPAAPNPFNPATTLRFTVRERGRVRLAVYDVSGRLVRVLVDGERAPGAEHVARWDGRDERGEPVASGVYFARLVTGGESLVRKLVLLK